MLNEGTHTPFFGEKRGPASSPRPPGPFADIARAIGEDLRELVETGSVPQRVAAALVDELGERAPSIVVIEDMHWADEASLDVFRLLAGRIAALPALLVATYRDDELADNHPVRLVVGELPSRSTSRIALERLSSAAVDELARQAERPAHGLYATTGGNPFFVTEVLRSTRKGFPRPVRDAVLARAGRGWRSAVLRPWQSRQDLPNSGCSNAWRRTNCRTSTSASPQECSAAHEITSRSATSSPGSSSKSRWRRSGESH